MRTYKPEVFGRQTASVGTGDRLLKSGGFRAFTLLELCVVIAVITILAALLLPALTRSKARAQAIMCINNSRNLVLAWTMYSMDNNDRLAYNQSSSAAQRMSLSPAAPNWVNNVMDWELTPGDTNMDFVNQSVLAPSARLSASIYRCPADRTVSAVQRSAGWTGRVRSISMNAMVGDPGTLFQGGVKLDNPGYTQFMKDGDFKDPSAIFVFLDEHPDSIDDGYFLNNPGTSEWIDLPGSYHNGGNSFSFADGHTEIHRWQCASTVRPNVPDSVDLPMAIAPSDTADFDWVNQRASYAVK